MTVNANLCALHGSYLFSETAARVAAFSQENPGKTLLRLGIGDVTLPVADAVVRALCAAAEEMGPARRRAWICADGRLSLCH